MAKLPVVSGRRCIAALERGGFYRHTREGSHVTLKRDQPPARVTVMDTRKELKPGTLRAIIRQAGLTVEEFRQLLV